MKSLIWGSLVLILGRSGVIHLSAATCLCILSVHHLRQLRLENPFLETYVSSVPSGKELQEFRSLLYAARANLAHGIVTRGIWEQETVILIPVFSLIWINGTPSCKAVPPGNPAVTVWAVWLWGSWQASMSAGRYPTHQKQCPWTYAVTRRRIPSMAKSCRDKPKWTLHKIRPVGAVTELCQITSDTAAGGSCVW